MQTDAGRTLKSRNRSSSCFKSREIWLSGYRGLETTELNSPLSGSTRPPALVQSDAECQRRVPHNLEARAHGGDVACHICRCRRAVQVELSERARQVHHFLSRKFTKHAQSTARQVVPHTNADVNRPARTTFNKPRHETTSPPNVPIAPMSTKLHIGCDLADVSRSLRIVSPTRLPPRSLCPPPTACAFADTVNATLGLPSPQHSGAHCPLAHPTRASGCVYFLLPPRHCEPIQQMDVGSETRRIHITLAPSCYHLCFRRHRHRRPRPALAAARRIARPRLSASCAPPAPARRPGSSLLWAASRLSSASPPPPIARLGPREVPPKQPDASPVSSVLPSAVDLRISGLTTANPPMSARTCIVMLPFVILASTLRCASAVPALRAVHSTTVHIRYALALSAARAVRRPQDPDQKPRRAGVIHPAHVAALDELMGRIDVLARLRRRRAVLAQVRRSSTVLVWYSASRRHTGWDHFVHCALCLMLTLRPGGARQTGVSATGATQ
ncbi:hypothetical protein GGX14DRAFT_560949 [Mycena pura]|uniref:Uncharacterized protein n=1 Tax=Mycena pura TaxID=153505 RepID=A0AAD6VPZ0_9AGAR|nr:hypothetical protein GGX14DRAFT_560949 [Mycena pura]